MCGCESWTMNTADRKLIHLKCGVRKSFTGTVDHQKDKSMDFRSIKPEFSPKAESY